MRVELLEFIGRTLRPVELRLIVKWILNLKRKRVVLSDGRFYNVDPISDFGLRLLKDKFYEPEMTHLVKDILKEGDCFIDLGANEGYFTILASKIVSSKGRVFAVEPQRRLWQVICDNLLINNVFNVQLLPYGIGTKSQEFELQLYPSTNSGATSFSGSYNFKISFGWLRKRIYGHQQSKIVPLDSLSDILPTKVKLIKIDIEGFEIEALKGMMTLLQHKVFCHLLIETHPEALKGINQDENMMDGFLSEAGYMKKEVGHNLNLYSLVQ